MDLTLIALGLIFAIVTLPCAWWIGTNINPSDLPRYA